MRSFPTGSLQSVMLERARAARASCRHEPATVRWPDAPLVEILTPYHRSWTLMHPGDFDAVLVEWARTEGAEAVERVIDRLYACETVSSPHRSDFRYRVVSVWARVHES